MKKFVKVIGILLVTVVLVSIGGITYITQALPSIPVQKELHVELTPERLARGEYLANHVTVCMDCHSTRNWDKFSAPLVPGTLGKGGEVFDQTMNFPGRFVSKNITPFNLKGWSDGEIFRAITSGVSRDGHPFFPVMPYPNFNQLATEDVYSIIAYLRTLRPIESHTDDSKADFPLNIILHTIPQPAHAMALPAPSDPTYGAYLVNACACQVCHTKTEKGKAVGEPFAGGFEFHFPNGATVRSANITPDPKNGIGEWDKATFILKFKQYADSSYVPPAVDWKAQDFQTVMPWMMYSGLTEQDLGAIYNYLRTVPAVASKVQHWSPAE